MDIKTLASIGFVAFLAACGGAKAGEECTSDDDCADGLECEMHEGEEDHGECAEHEHGEDDDHDHE